MTIMVKEAMIVKEKQVRKRKGVEEEEEEESGKSMFVLCSRMVKRCEDP